MKYTFLLTIALLLAGCGADPIQSKESYAFYPDGTVKSIGNFKDGKHPDKENGFQVYETYDMMETSQLFDSLELFPLLKSAPGAFYCERSQQDRVNAQLRLHQKAFPDVQFAWAIAPEMIEGKELYMLHALRKPGEYDFPVRGDGISAVAMTEEEYGPTLSITFLPETAERFARLTTDNIGNQLAMVVDGKVLSAPTVQSAISNGHVQISGNFTKQQAEDMQQLLQSYILNGEWRSYHKNGKLKEIRNYTSGEQTGSWSKFDENGKLVSKRELKTP